MRPVCSFAVTSPLHSNIFKIFSSVALRYSDWSILPGQSLPHEELYRSVIIFVIQELKSSGMWCNRRSESPVYPSLGAACSAVVYRVYESVLYVDMYWPAPLSLAYWPGRQSLEYSRSILDNFFYKSEMYILTYIQCTGCQRYCRLFCDTNINLHKIFKNNNRLMKFSGIVYLYLDFTFSGWNCL